MGITKWYEVVCDICGETIHTPKRNKHTLAHYGFILKGDKVYCSKECVKIKLNKGEYGYRDANHKLQIINLDKYENN